MAVAQPSRTLFGYGAVHRQLKTNRILKKKLRRVGYSYPPFRLLFDFNALYTAEIAVYILTVNTLISSDLEIIGFTFRKT